MGSYSDLNQEDLRAACADLVRNMLKNEDVHPVEVDALVERFYGIAIHHLKRIVEQSRDPYLLVRAVRYVTLTHAGAARDAGWFATILECLVELACPSRPLSSDRAAFIADLRQGLERNLEILPDDSPCRPAS
jgi:hypothetical protein